MRYRTLAYDAAPAEADRLAALVADTGVARLEVTSSCDRLTLARALSRGNTDIVVLGLHAGAREELAVVRRIGATAPTQIVYVGWRDAFASEVYETPHVAFLLRPVARHELDAAIARAVRALARWRTRPVVVRTLDGRERTIRPSAVSHVQSHRHLLRIHVGSEVIETRGKKSELASLLPECFVQCHRSHLVNLGCVNSLDTSGATLTTGEVVPVSRERLESTRTAYRDYVGRAL